MKTKKRSKKNTPKQAHPSSQPLPKNKNASHGPEAPRLRFTPYAWAKLHYFCHAGDTEIGGFGLTTAKDPLLVVDFLTVKQQVSCVSVEFDDEAVAEMFEQQVDAGHRPEQFARIWLHTHPGDSPHPSGTDEETFARVFGGCDWAVMFILARGGQTYARLRFNSGPGGEIEIPVAVDYTQPFPGADHEAWGQEYDVHIHPEPLLGTAAWGTDYSGFFVTGDYGAWDDDYRRDLFDGLDPVPPFDPQDLEQDREQIELLMDEYGVSDIAALRAILQHENQALLEQCG